MLQSLRLSLLFIIPSLAAFSCAAPGSGGDGDDVVGTGAKSGSGSAPGSGSVGGDGDITIIPLGCGDGVLQENESCDDANEVSGDGCTAACQLELDFECPTVGQPCVSTVACGNSILTTTEACDDGNAVAGDGCSADCGMIEAGYQCRVPGALCVPLCGDGVLTGSENCDDLNAISGDGCSSTCLTEPGYSCEGTVCTASVCGNGVVEAGESCDAGANNGLFYGDGTGCSKTCTDEPVCSDAAGNRTACSTACGDGHIDAGETCDDGNAIDGDGCSSACMDEGGFTCTTVQNRDTTDCSAGGAECLVLPIIYRDFDGEHEATGHPDFFYMGAGGRRCVPNASGQQDDTTTYPGTGTNMCWTSDSTDLCPGIVANTLGDDGKPAYNAAHPGCDCRFTDWDETGIHDTDNTTTTCNSGGALYPKWYQQLNVPVVESAVSFAQWFNDDATVNTTVVGTLELAAIGGDLYQYSSSGGLTVYDDIRMANNDQDNLEGGTLSSGFFPLEDQTRPKVCNIWPYWVPNANCNADVGEVPDDQWDPSANMGGGEPVQGIIGVERNFYFTTEVRYLFRFAGGEQLSFFGDDDVFVFINGVLALDLGAPHERLSGQVTLPAGPGGATYAISAVDVSVATPVTTIPIATGTSPPLNMTPGNTYEIAIFHADRHPRESNYQLTLQGFSTNQSSCVPTCGDSVATTGEECDNGAANSDTEYGGCTTECKFGPFCGDGMIAEGVEECDLGRDNNAQYGQQGCTSGCLLPHFCGDGNVDGAFGEECDDGANNGQGACKADCTLIVR